MPGARSALDRFVDGDRAVRPVSGGHELAVGQTLAKRKFPHIRNVPDLAAVDALAGGNINGRDNLESRVG